MSELYGTVLIISLSFAMAIMLAGVGYYVMGGMSDETEDSIVQDAAQVMDDRITEVTGASVDSTSEFSIPQGADVTSSEIEDGLRITISSTVDSTQLAADSETYETSLSLGTVLYEGEGNTKSVWQGGGLWTYEDGATIQNSPPGLNYDGNALDLSLTSVSESGDIRAGDTVAVQSDRDSSIEVSSSIEDEIRDRMVVQPGSEELGTVPVDITVEIETEFADVWETYVSEGMDQEPDGVEVNDDSIELTFLGVGGGEFDPFEEANKYIDDDEDEWNDAGPGQTDWDILYAGSTMYAELNRVLDSTEDGDFEVNETAVEDESVDLVGHGGGQAPEIYVGFEDDDRLAYAELGEVINDVDEMVSVDDETYDVSGSPFVCVFKSVPGQANDSVNKCLGAETNLDSGEFLDNALLTVEELEVTEGEPLEPDEEIEVEADIRNEGVLTPADNQSLVVRVETDDGGLADGEYMTVDTITANGSHDSDEIKKYEFKWTPGESDHAEIYENLGDETTVQVDTGVDTETENLEVSKPATFEIDSVESNVEGDGDGGAELDIDATIENTGDLSDEQSVALWRTTDDDRLYMDSSDSINLDGGDNDTVRLEYAFDDQEMLSDLSIELTTEDDTKSFDDFVDPAVYEIDINEGASDLDVTYPDTTIDVEFDIENVGQLDGSKFIGLEVDGVTEVVSDNPIDVERGETETRNLSFEANAEDHHDADTVVVRTEDAEEAEASFSYTRDAELQLNVNDDPESSYDADANDEIEIEYNVMNLGTEDATNAEVQLLLDGEVVESEGHMFDDGPKPQDGEDGEITYEVDRDDAAPDDVDVELRAVRGNDQDDSADFEKEITAEPEIVELNVEDQSYGDDCWWVPFGNEWCDYYTSVSMDYIIDDPSGEVDSVEFEADDDRGDEVTNNFGDDLSGDFSSDIDDDDSIIGEADATIDWTFTVEYTDGEIERSGDFDADF